MPYRDGRLGEHTMRRDITVASLSTLALLTGCSSSSTESSTAPAPAAISHAPTRSAAAACEALEIVAYGSSKGNTFTFTLIGRWAAGVKVVGEELSITRIKPKPAHGQKATIVPIMPSPNGQYATNETVAHSFHSTPAYAKYAVQGTIAVNEGGHTMDLSPPSCFQEVPVVVPGSSASENTNRIVPGDNNLRAG